MKFIPAKCPTCQGELQVPDDKDFIICMYCGVNVKVRDALKLSLDKNIPNLLELAYEELRFKNYQKALNEFDKILELDIKTPEAWIGKGIVSAKLSNVENIKFEEMFSYFENSTKYCSEDMKDNINKKITNSIIENVMPIYDELNNYLRTDYGNSKRFWFFIGQVEQFIYALELAFYCNPNNKYLFDFSFGFCEENLIIINNRFRTGSRDGDDTELNNKLNELKEKLEKIQIKLNDIDPQKYEVMSKGNKERQKEVLKKIQNKFYSENMKILYKFIILYTLTGSIFGIILSVILYSSYYGSKTFFAISTTIEIFTLIGFLIGYFIGNSKRKSISK